MASRITDRGGHLAQAVEARLLLHWLHTECSRIAGSRQTAAGRLLCCFGACSDHKTSLMSPGPAWSPQELITPRPEN